MKVALAILALSVCSFACGKERWEVKTSVTNQEAADRSLLALTELPAPSKAVLLKLVNAHLPNEVPVKVQATVIGFKLEADGDIHIVLSDGTSTIIAEIPEPACVKDARLRAEIDAVRRKFVSIFGKPTQKMKKVTDKTPLIFTGQLFFDFIHGQSGVAKNGIEIHPVIAIE